MILQLCTDACESQLLADAERHISDSTKQENDVLSVDYKDSDAVVTSEPVVITSNNLPEWAQPLEPVRKLPTNVGTRIRKCIYNSLEKNPPEWAKEILEHSISKEVYKGNASGPTKVNNPLFSSHYATCLDNCKVSLVFVKDYM